MNDTERDLLSSQWKSVASALKLEFIAPMSLRLPDGTNFEFAGLLPQFGGQRGMLIGVELSAIASAAAMSAGYGVSSMSPEYHHLPVNAADYVECLVDWGWCASCAAPQWYLDAS
jgi:hypothetical protein